jgi:hypothetical protein
VAEIVAIAAQAVPGGARIARLLRLPMGSIGGRRRRRPPVPGAAVAEGGLPEVDPTGLASEDEL